MGDHVGLLVVSFLVHLADAPFEVGIYLRVVDHGKEVKVDAEVAVVGEVWGFVLFGGWRGHPGGRGISSAASASSF